MTKFRVGDKVWCKDLCQAGVVAKISNRTHCLWVSSGQRLVLYLYNTQLLLKEETNKRGKRSLT